MPQLILADKSDLFRRSMSGVLGREGFEVLLAENGSKALKLLEESRPVAMILDTEIEGPEALEVLRQIKNEARFKRMPVVVVSRENVPAAVSAYYRLGADAYMVKPIELNDLIKTLHGFTRPVPALNAPVILTIGEAKLVGKVRFLDDFGAIYLDKEAPESIAPVGSQGVISFPEQKTVYYQVVRISEENEQGIGLTPVGVPSKSETPEPTTLTTTLKARYLLPGQFMKLATISQISSGGFQLKGLASEPKFNSPVKATIYSPSLGVDCGIAVEGKIVGYQPLSGEPGLLEAEVVISEPVEVPFVHLLDELLSGRPMRAES